MDNKNINKEIKEINKDVDRIDGEIKGIKTELGSKLGYKIFTGDSLV